jgi:chromosomal replication initiator protein
MTGHPAFRDPDRLSEAEELAARATALINPPPGPRPGFRMHDLVRCPANSLVLQTAAEIIAEPGTRYNPLFVHGPVGVGKTHLAHAIGNALAARDHGTWTVACVTAAAFIDELIAALQGGTVDGWRARYRAVDALIVDDLQALDGKERTQEEFFNLFNVLHRNGRQIVLCSDRAPAAFTSLDARLRSRFEGGLVAEMAAAPQTDRSGRFTPVPGSPEVPPDDPNAESAYYRDPEGYTSLAGLAGTPDDSGTFPADPEKVVLEWPDVTGRVIEDWI